MLILPDYFKNVADVLVQGDFHGESIGLHRFEKSLAKTLGTVHYDDRAAAG